MADTKECIFCAIAAGEAPAEVVFDGGDTVWFRDIDPKATVHVIGVPKKHLSSLAEVSGDDHALLGKLLHEAADVAEQEGVFGSGAGGGYRLLTNVGADAGQEVPHLHFHLLGGESLGPIRC